VHGAKSLIDSYGNLEARLLVIHLCTSRSVCMLVDLCSVQVKPRENWFEKRLAFAENLCKDLGEQPIAKAKPKAKPKAKAKAAADKPTPEKSEEAAEVPNLF